SAWGRVGVGRAGGGGAVGCGPFEDAGAGLFHCPAGLVFEGVVSAAEHGEVVGGGFAAVLVVVGVVDVAPGGGLVAGGEAAVPVAVVEEASQAGGGPVGVGGDGDPGDRVGDDPHEFGGAGGEVARGVQVDGALP